MYSLNPAITVMYYAIHYDAQTFDVRGETMPPIRYSIRDTDSPLYSFLQQTYETGQTPEFCSYAAYPYLQPTHNFTSHTQAGII